MNWIPLKNQEEINQIKDHSHDKPVIIFKHSTRCSISSMVLNRLERSWSEEEVADVKPYYLDLLKYRDISNMIADEFKIPHQSPQVLMLKNGEVVYHDSHMNISYETIKEAAKS